MQPHEIVHQLASTSSRLEKESIIEREMLANNQEFICGYSLAFSPFVIFGVKQIPKSTTGGKGLSWQEFEDLAQQLSSRQLTGHAARDAILVAMAKSQISQWNHWYRLILLKDLKCGLSEKTINNVAEKLGMNKCTVPIFSCQLATDGTDLIDNLSGNWLVDTKLDGTRLLTIVYPNGNVQQFTRNGKEIVNFPLICAQFAANAGSLNEPWVFDGEIMSTSFQDLMGQLRRKTDVQTDDAQLYLFDAVPLSSFLQGEYSELQSTRSAWLANYLASCNMNNVHQLNQELIDFDTVAGRLRFDVINRMAVDAGYEGIMLKSPTAPYVCKRKKNWLKLKPTITVDLVVIDVLEGSADSQFVGTMGALVCEGEDQGKFICVQVGGGFSIKERAEIWATHTNKPVMWTKTTSGNHSEFWEEPLPEPIVGRTIEVKADAVTQAENSEYYSLRFPRKHRFRNDK
jgi:DNA ligase 1